MGRIEEGLEEGKVVALYSVETALKFAAKGKGHLTERVLKGMGTTERWMAINVLPATAIGVLMGAMVISRTDMSWTKKIRPFVKPIKDQDITQDDERLNIIRGEN